MAKLVINKHKATKRTRRPNVHSKNASKGQVKVKKKYRGQGR